MKSHQIDKLFEGMDVANKICDYFFNDGLGEDIMTETDESGSFFKKWAMRQYWRMQQSQAVVSLILWGTTITLLVWPYLRWRFEPGCGDATFCFSDELIGIPVTYFGLAGIFLSVMLGVLLIGFLYDQVFSLWNEWRTVDMERNPYVTYALTPVWVMIMAAQAENLKRQSNGDEKLLAQADWYLEWCKKYTDGEMFARAVQQWDKELGTTPTFWFTDDEAMQKAREIDFSSDEV